MTLDDETAANLAREVIGGGKAARVYPHSTDVALVRAGWDARDAEVEELQAWKAQALDVLGGWERVWEAAGMPGRLGEQKSECVRREVEELRAERDEWKGSANEWAEAFADTMDERDAALATLAKVADLLGSLDLDSNITSPGTAWGSILREALELARGVDESPTERETPADEWEYRPGYIGADGQVRITSPATIAPDYVQEYMAEGGKVVRRHVGPFEEVVPDDRTGE